MSSIATSQSIKTGKQRKPYVAPACRQLSPEAATRVLLEQADVNDPEVKNMLRLIAELEKQNRLELSQ
jgi:hypothetical protein